MGLQPTDWARFVTFTKGTSMTDWLQLTTRAAACVHDVIGWIIFDPRAKERYADLGIPDGLGQYVATRFGPIAEAGTDAVGATGYSINNAFLGLGLDLMHEHADAETAMRSRDDAVLIGLEEIAPGLAAQLGELADHTWSVVDKLPNCGRVLFAAHRDRTFRAEGDPALSAWLAFNCLREWRGDTHWALCVAADLDGAEVGLLHNAMVNYDDNEWIAKSRGATPEEIVDAWERLEEKGFAASNELTEAGKAARLEIEKRTDEICVRMWKLFGESETADLCTLIEANHDAFMQRIEATAGPNWMPAARYK